MADRSGGALGSARESNPPCHVAITLAAGCVAHARPYPSTTALSSSIDAGTPTVPSRSSRSSSSPCTALRRPCRPNEAGLDVALRNSAGDFVFIERFGGVVWERSPEDGAMRLGVQLWLPDDLPSGAWELVLQATDLVTSQSTDAGVELTVLSSTS